MTENTPELDVLIIGGGQAGLAMGYHLKETPFSFRIAERHARVGDSWRNRYASLVLFTPRSYSALPGLAVPGDPEGFPTKDEMADYLEAYAERFELPVAPSTGIRRLERLDGGFRATTEAGEPIDSRAVVLATGAFQRPAAIPPISNGLAEEVAQLSPEDYRTPGQVAAGRVLVVGDGATGRQIALELTENHEVLLAAGRPRRVSPDRILGRSVFWWMDRLGVLGASRESPIGRFLMKADPFPGKHLEFDNLQQRGVEVVDRVTQAEGKKVSFADGKAAEVDAVVWATGYRDDTGWVDIPEVKDDQDNFMHYRGVSPLPYLCFVGRSWQWTRGSALFAGVGQDAAYLAEHLVGLFERRAAA
jgi:putative flavoprotein involved in K+ transport